MLAPVPADRRGTLIAHKESKGRRAVYRFDIRAQGDNETGFFEIQPFAIDIGAEAGSRTAHFRRSILVC